MFDRERAEAKKHISSQKFCGYGQLPDLLCSQLKIIVVILDGVVMVMARCLTESAPRRKKNDIQNYCGYGQLPGVVRSKLEANITNSRQVTARCLTLIWWR